MTFTRDEVKSVFVPFVLRKALRQAIAKMIQGQVLVGVFLGDSRRVGSGRGKEHLFTVLI